MPPQSIRSTIGNVELDGTLTALATKICWGILLGSKQKRGHFRPLFRLYPEVSREDVHQEMLLAICRQWNGYDPSLAQPQTFMHQRAKSAMLDVHRRCQAGKSKVQRAAKQMREEDFLHHDERPEDAERPLEQMLAENLVLARKNFSKRRYRRGRRLYTMPQMIAIAMLMRQMKFGYKRAHATLSNRPELVTSLALKQVPCSRSLARAAVALRKFELDHTPKPEKGDNIG